MVEDGVRHRLAAIMAADVAGYSRLMADDERATIASLDASRAVFREQIEAHGGRVVDMAGDSVLAVFEAAASAVEAARTIQEGIEACNVALPEIRRMRYRLGVHLGDIHEKSDGTIYGDGVNVAARLEGLGEPGAVTVSGMAYEAVRGKVNAEFVFIGEHEVKNMATPVRAYRIGTPGAASAQVEGKEPNAQAGTESIFDQPAIAVLPFDNMSGDPEQEFFVDGLTEDIITALAAWRSFPVIARNSTFAYKGQSPDIRQVGKELGARYVLEGGVRKGANRLRITAQLIDASNGHHLWADRYDRQLEDIFELQDEMTHHITAIVAPEVERAEQKRLIAREPANFAAWEYCQRGMALLEHFTKQGNSEARDMFMRALQSDPNYALAYGGLAESHNRDLMLEFSDDRAESAANSFAAAKKAIENDQTDSYAHAMLAVAHMWPNRFEASVAAAERAVELNPSNAQALAILATALEALSRHDDAIERFEQSLQISPRDPRRHIYFTNLARAYLGARAYEKAIEIARKTINQRHDFAHSHYILASALGHRGQLTEARAELDECERLHPGYVERRLNYAPYNDPGENEHLHAGVHAALTSEADK